MKDNEIIKGLEYCVVECNCANCPLYEDKYMSKECVEIEARALDLIKRQRAEIEVLREIVFMDRSEAIKNLKAEARNEFVERLKVKTKNIYLTNKFHSIIDNLLKEMEGK